MTTPISYQSLSRIFMTRTPPVVLRIMLHPHAARTSFETLPRNLAVINTTSKTKQQQAADFIIMVTQDLSGKFYSHHDIPWQVHKILSNFTVHDMCKISPFNQPFKAYLLRAAPSDLTFNNCTFCPHCIHRFCI